MDINNATDFGTVKILMLKGEKGDQGESGDAGDYSGLTNKPSINNVMLIGNKTSADLGMVTEQEIDAIRNDFDAIRNDFDALKVIGEIKPLAHATIPDGWLLCDGSVISRSTYSELFTRLGTVWGGGDGSSTFAIPDLRGRTPIGAGSISSQSANTTDGTDAITAGAVNKSLGNYGGANKHTLIVNELAKHRHNTNVASIVGGPSGQGWNFNGQGGSTVYTDYQGTDTPHNTMQPYSTVNYIIYTGVA